MREIISWYGLADNMKNIVSQKILVKQIAVTQIISKKAKTMGFHKLDAIVRHADLMNKKSLARILLTRWREEEEKKPEKLYQTESIILTNTVNEHSKKIPNKKSPLLEFIKKVSKKIVNGELDFKSSPDYANRHNKTIKYFNLEYLPMNAMEDTYQKIVFQLHEQKQKFSAPIKNPYGWQLIHLNDVVFVEKDNFDEYFEQKDSSNLGRLYWNRTLKFRNIDWKKQLLKKYGINYKNPPLLPTHWQKKKILFRNKNFMILAKDFDLFRTMQLRLTSTNHHSFSNKDQPRQLFEHFLELVIFSNEAKKNQLDQTDEFKRLKIWEKNNLLVKAYVKKHWSTGKPPRDKKEIEKLKKDRTEKEKVLLKEHNFQIMDSNFQSNFI